MHKGTHLQSGNRLTDRENRRVTAKEEGVGEGRTGSLGLAYVHF